MRGNGTRSNFYAVNIVQNWCHPMCKSRSGQMWVSPSELVLLIIDSMGDNDPSLAANPDLPVVFVFNEEAIRKLQLSSRRIGFYLQTLQDLSQRREVQVFLGDSYQFAKGLGFRFFPKSIPVGSATPSSGLAEIIFYEKSFNFLDFVKI